MAKFLQAGFVSSSIKAATKRVILGMVLFGTMASAPSSKADTITVGPAFGIYQTGGGGEFTFVPDAPIAALLGEYSPFTVNQYYANSFQTFCAEENERIYTSTTYDVNLNNVTVYGGITLSVGAAALYREFATGTLPLYNYADIGSVNYHTRAYDPANPGIGSAYQLQRAIWYFMGHQVAYDSANIYENGTVPVPINPFSADNGAHRVAVLNTWVQGQPHDLAHARQDSLILTPIPEPSVFALTSFGLAGLALRKRRASA